MDGLPIEFYSTFINILTPILRKVFIASFARKQLPQTMYHGIISQIYKGKGNRLERNSWRPLTMLNTDYKILAKLLTLRVNKVMSLLVHTDQNCAVPGRDIQDGILHLYNTMEIMKSNKNGILLSVDQEAAFDRIEWNFIEKALIKFNFPYNFLQWFKIIYKDKFTKSRVLVNGFQSKPFNVSRGVRQGCPLSPLLYVLSK